MTNLTEEQFGTQIEALETHMDTRIDRVEEDVKSVKNDVKSLKEDMTSVKIEMVVMRKDMDVLRNDVNVVKEDVRLIQKDIGGIHTSIGRIEEKLNIHHVQQDVRKAHTELYKWATAVVISAIASGVSMFVGSRSQTATPPNTSVNCVLPTCTQVPQQSVRTPIAEAIDTHP